MSVFVELPQVASMTSGDTAQSSLININDIRGLLALSNGRTAVDVRGRLAAITPLPYEEVKRRISEATTKAASVPRFIRVTDNDGDLALVATDSISAVTRTIDVDDDDREASKIHFKGESESTLPVQHTVSEIAAMLGL